MCAMGTEGGRLGARARERAFVRLAAAALLLACAALVGAIWRGRRAAEDALDVAEVALMVGRSYDAAVAHKALDSFQRNASSFRCGEVLAVARR